MNKRIMIFLTLLSSFAPLAAMEKNITFTSTDEEKISVDKTIADRSNFLKGYYSFNTLQKKNEPGFIEADLGLSKKDYSKIATVIKKVNKGNDATLDVHPKDLKTMLHAMDYLGIDHEVTKLIARDCDVYLDDKEKDELTKNVIKSYPIIKLSDEQLKQRFVASCGALNLENLGLESTYGLESMYKHFQPKQIKIVYLNNNKLKKVDRRMIKSLLATFPALECLDLSNNEITAIEEKALVDLPHGFKLLLNNNKIKKFAPDCVQSFENGLIDVSGNEHINREIINNLHKNLEPTKSQMLWGATRKTLVNYIAPDVNSQSHRICKGLSDLNYTVTGWTPSLSKILFLCNHGFNLPVSIRSYVLRGCESVLNIPFEKANTFIKTSDKVNTLINSFYEWKQLPKGMQQMPKFKKDEDIFTSIGGSVFWNSWPFAGAYMYYKIWQNQWQQGFKVFDFCYSLRTRTGQIRWLLNNTISTPIMNILERASQAARSNIQKYRPHYLEGFKKTTLGIQPQQLFGADAHCLSCKKPVQEINIQDTGFATCCKKLMCGNCMNTHRQEFEKLKQLNDELNVILGVPENLKNKNNIKQMIHITTQLISLKKQINTIKPIHATYNTIDSDKLINILISIQHHPYIEEDTIQQLRQQIVQIGLDLTSALRCSCPGCATPYHF